ncbi:hypothetical protein GCM10007147_02870 [Nocardiopsis kunsanensis]|uniref:Uncharacterized protein n=1 Tax=Nocardiopsis kunsanensis TaxID=141693 RepID=A0A918X732_9ACTN|nr:hypothetical protein [Nocardiopsis kunsanensis]GHD15491.1 hypothetical protein GCM10007147_02870 [Nocardiopsis kunsanensis]
MSRSESRFGRKGRRGGSRRGQAAEPVHTDEYGHDEDYADEYDYDPEEDFSAEYGHTHTRSEGPGQAGYDDGYDDGYEDEYGAEQASAQGRGRGRRGRRADRNPGKVSAFSANALKRVSVLGDRPNQIVYTLAEQSRRKRGTAVLAVLLTAFGLALVLLLGLLTYQFISNDGGQTADTETSIVEPPEGHTTLTPELYLSEPNREETFGAIDEREADAEPMTEESVFGGAEELELDDISLQAQETGVNDSCTSMVWGGDLAQSLLDAECANAASALYTDSDQEYVAQVTLFDVADSNGAEEVAAALDPTNTDTEAGFVLPQTGEDIAGLNEGYSQATTQVMGHYVAVFWTARQDAEDPGDNSDLATVNVASMNSVQFIYDEVVRNGGGSPEEE